MKFQLPIEVSNLTELADFSRYVSQVLNGLISIINGQISLLDNVQCSIVTATINTANMEQTVPHTLGRVPTGFILIGSKAATICYNGIKASTSDFIYIRATVPTTVSLLIF